MNILLERMACFGFAIVTNLVAEVRSKRGRTVTIDTGTAFRLTAGDALPRQIESGHLSILMNA
jgi:hypothetical protein